MSSYPVTINELFALQSKAEQWRSGDIFLQVHDSLHGTAVKTINLSQTIGHAKHVPRANKRDDSNCYWLAHTLNENNSDIRQKKIHPIFVRACRAAGFLVHGEYEKADRCIQFQP